MSARSIGRRKWRGKPDPRDLRRQLRLSHRRCDADDEAEGDEDDDDVEILNGLALGETYAVANTFTLKAELEKAEASEGEH